MSHQLTFKLFSTNKSLAHLKVIKASVDRFTR